MEDESWLCDLAFLVDITTCMNELNTRLPRKAQYASEQAPAHKRLYEKVETLARTHTECKSLSLSNFKRNGNPPREKDRICRSTDARAI